MIEIDKPNIDIVELSTQGSRSVGKFVVEPLERGFGTTLGNGMRRVLLSSLPGYAITSVKIDGVLHEFSSIPNVVEDVPEIIVNLKNVRLKFDAEEEKVLRLRFGLDDGRARTLEEVGKEFNVTRERIRQIETRAISKLKKLCKNQNLSGNLKNYIGM